MTVTTLMDGDVGAEVERRLAAGRSPNDLPGHRGLTVAEALIECPSAIRAAHDDYISAGADVITMATAALTPVDVCRQGLESHLDDMLSAASGAALDARDAAGRTLPVAACIGPLAAQPDRQDAGLVTMIGVYEYLLSMIAGDADFIFCVGIGSVNEAEAAALAAAMTSRPVWLSFAIDSARPGCLSSGDSLMAAIAAVDSLPIETVLVESPDMGALARSLPISGLSDAEDLADPDRRRIGHGCRPDLRNGGLRGNDPAGGRDHARSSGDISMETLGYLAEDWLDAGATVIGGGRGVTPRHTAHLRSIMDIRPPED